MPGASGAWNLIDAANDSASEAAVPYFKEIFDYARTLDPQHRPLTYTNLMMAAGGKDKCHQFADVICLNRYYGGMCKMGISSSEPRRPSSTR